MTALESESVVEFAAPPPMVSISSLANEFQMRRETISKRLKEANVQPGGMRKGYAVYRLRDAVRAIFEPEMPMENGIFDPMMLPPERRSIWYQAQLRQMEVEKMAAAYLPARDHYEGLHEMATDLAKFLQTLSPYLESEVSMSSDQIGELRKVVEQQRQNYIAHAAAAEANLNKLKDR